MRKHEEKEPSFSVVREIWGRRKWLATVIFLLSVAFVIATVWFLPGLYRSTATVLVELSQVPEALVRSSVTSEVETRIHTIGQKMLSRGNVRDFILRYDLYPDLRARQVPMEVMIDRMRRDIGVELKKTDQGWGRSATIAFTVSYLGRDPRTVAEVTNGIASFYVEEDLRMRELQTTGAVDFLKDQLAEVKQRLDAHERRVSEFKLRHSGELPDQIPAILAALGRINAQLQLNNDHQIRVLERRDALLKKWTDMADRLAKLEEKLAVLRTQYTDRYADVILVKAEIEALERLMSNAPLNGVEVPRSELVPGSMRASTLQSLEGIETELNGLQAEEKSLRQAIATHERRIENAPKLEQFLQELLGDSEATKERYYSLLERYEEAELGNDMEQRRKGGKFRILDSAVPSKAPNAPNRVRLIVMGLMFALGIAVGITIMTEKLNTSFHTVEQLRSFTTIPVLVGIPRIVTDAETQNRRRRFSLGMGGIIVALVTIVTAAYSLAHENEGLVRVLARGGS